MAGPTQQNVLDSLAAVPLFSACSKTELKRIARLGTEVALSDGSVLTKQGEPGYEFFLITDGRVRCLVDRKLVANS